VTGVQTCALPISLSDCNPSYESTLKTPLALSNWLRKTPRNRWPRTYRELHATGLGAEVLDWLELVVALSDSIRWEEETVVTTFLHCLSTDEFHELLARRGRMADTARAIVQGLQWAPAGQPEVQTSGQVDSTLAVLILTALRGITAERWTDCEVKGRVRALAPSP
jgi:Ca-activated chloride channel family protein